VNWWQVGSVMFEGREEAQEVQLENVQQLAGMLPKNEKQLAENGENKQALQLAIRDV